MDENPYYAAQSTDRSDASSTKRHPCAPAKGVILGALAGGLPVLILLAIAAFWNYRDKQGGFDIRFVLDVVLSRGIPCALAGAAMGAAIQMAARWLHSPRAEDRRNEREH
jgi:hypothetical protein